MVVKSLKITNFRNYKNLSISFSPNINIIYGDNGQGKTNLLESIYVLGITKSHRSFIDNYLINNESVFAKISGIVDDGVISSKYEVIIEPQKKILKKDDNVINKINEYISKMNIIIFYPEDLELIKGSPSERRKYLNIQLSQIHKNYLKILNDYNKILKQRNELLKKYLKTQEIDKDYFEALTETLIERGIKIYQYRENYISNINKNVSDIYYNLIKIKNFKILYKPSIKFNNYDTEYIIKKYKEELEKTYDSELKQGMTIIGPHRDDFEFVVGTQNLKIFGSQGQQRLAVLSLKLSEVPIFKSYKKTYPILLLDDVFSELDDRKKNNLLKYITNNIQTFITTTDLKSINPEVFKSAKIIKVDNGKIITEEEV